MSVVSVQVQYPAREHRVGPRRAMQSMITPALRRWLMPAQAVPEETAFMQSGPSRESSPAECESSYGSWPAQSHEPGSAWPSAAAERVDAKARLTRLASTLESDVIPRLVGAHAHEHHARAARKAPACSAREVEGFVALLRNGSDDDLGAAASALHRRGLAVEGIFLQLFAPAARHLGELWVADRCDFSTVTICLGRLQRLLREWSPAFGNEVEHPPNGRRILLAQHPDEQHSFGMSMVAEFFRRDGWEVLGGVGGAVPDPSSQVSREWFDAVGFSIGSETRLDWLRERIAQVRAATRNRSVVVLVGGPLFVLQPGLAQAVGADGSGKDGGSSPRLAEDLLAARAPRR